MARVQIPTHSSSIPRARVCVQVRQTWSDEWQEVDYLQPLEAVHQAQPGLSQATLRYDYGSVIREDGSAFATAAPLRLANWFVRIGLLSYDDEPVATWTGIISDLAYSVHGGDPEPGGVQTLVAYGLEHLLDGVRVRSAKAAQGGGTAELPWCPPFNERYGRGPGALGNRTTTASGGLHRFSGDGAQWTNSQIIDRLMTDFAPTTGACDGMNWAWGGDMDILEAQVGQYALDGLTLRQALNTLIDRRRGQGWVVRVVGDTVGIHVFSVFDEPVTVEGRTIQPNADIVRFTLDGDAAHSLSDVVLWRQLSQRATRVVVRGQRILSTFTVGYGVTSTLEIGWTAAEQAALLAAAGDDMDENALHRASRQHARVGCYHRIPDAWNWMARSGGNANPKANDDGTVDRFTTGDYWNHAKHFEPFVPFEDEAENTTEPRYVRPLVFVQHPEHADKFVQLDRPPAVEGGGAMLPPIAVQLMAHEMALMLKTHPLTMMFGLTDTAGIFVQQPIYKYTSLDATVAVRTDQHLQVVAEIADRDDAGPEREVLVSVPQAEYWHITPGTVDRVETDGTLHVWDGGTPVRDDSDLLLMVAALAKAWYRKERSAVEITMNYLSPTVRVGSMVEGVFLEGDVIGVEIHTTVSQVRWDFRAQRTYLRTQFAELDYT